MVAKIRAAGYEPLWMQDLEAARSALSLPIAWGLRAIVVAEKHAGPALEGLFASIQRVAPLISRVLVTENVPSRQGRLSAAANAEIAACSSDEVWTEALTSGSSHRGEGAVG
jgi:hypothetical protein